MLAESYRLLIGFAAVLPLLRAPLHAQSDADPLPVTHADPALPMLQLPTGFRARRTSANLAMEAGKPVEIFNVTVRPACGTCGLSSGRRTSLVERNSEQPREQF